jgi:hypothetical protein
VPFGDSGSSKTQTTTSSSAPWGPIQAPAKQGIADWTKLYNSGGLSVDPYPGQTVAGTAPEQSAAWKMVSDIAGDPSKSSVGAATNYNNAILRGDYSALQPMFDAARDAAGSTYEAAGRYGSGYHDNAVSKGVGSVIANAASTAASQAPGLQQAMYQPAQYLDQVGQERQGQAQTEINANITKYNAQKNQQAQAIQSYLAGLQGNWGATNTQTVPVQGQGTSWQDLFGAGLGAGGLALGAYSAGVFG